MQPKTRVWMAIIIEIVLIGSTLYSALFQDRFLWILLFATAVVSVVFFYLLRDIVFKQNGSGIGRFVSSRTLAYQAVGGTIGIVLVILYNYFFQRPMKWEVYAGISIGILLAWTASLALANKSG